MKFAREIERKFVVIDSSNLKSIQKRLETVIFADIEHTLVGKSIDTFWLAPNVDFIRLRKNSQELTVKITDRGTVTNRVEENLDLPNYKTGYRWATAVFGEEAGTLEKTYFVYYLDPDLVISLYRVTGDERVFLEVEGPSISKVDSLVKFLEKSFELKQETRSLFQIFLGSKERRKNAS